MPGPNTREIGAGLRFSPRECVEIAQRFVLSGTNLPRGINVPRPLQRLEPETSKAEP